MSEYYRIAVYYMEIVDTLHNLIDNITDLISEGKEVPNCLTKEFNRHLMIKGMLENDVFLKHEKDPRSFYNDGLERWHEESIKTQKKYIRRVLN